MRERALETAAIGSFMALLYGLLSHLATEANDPLAVLPAVATASVLATAILVRAFMALREAQRRSPRPASGETAPGAVLGLGCALLVVPVLLATIFVESAYVVHPAEVLNVLVVGILLAAALELSAVFLALYTRGVIERSNGSLGGRGLTTATIVIALVNLLGAVAILLGMLR